MPFHLRLTLSDTKTTGPYWHSQNRGWFVVAALLKAVGISKLVDIKPCVKGLYRNDEVHVLKAARQLAAQVDGTITGLARKRGNNQQFLHRVPPDMTLSTGVLAQQKAARRRLLNSNPMNVDHAAINAGFDFRR